MHILVIAFIVWLLPRYFNSPSRCKNVNFQMIALTKQRISLGFPQFLAHVGPCRAGESLALLPRFLAPVKTKRKLNCWICLLLLHMLIMENKPTLLCSLMNTWHLLLERDIFLLLIICIPHNFEMRIYKCTKLFFTFFCFIYYMCIAWLLKKTAAAPGDTKAPENVV